MHIKRIHEMVEKLTECTLSAINANESNIGDFAIPDVVDMIKDLCEAEKDARIAKEMEKCDEEDKEEEKYLLNRLKEEYKDEYRQMEERYGEDADRRFYDSWRHADGTFARKGTGSYRPRSSGRRGRRGYEEAFIPMDYRMDMEDYAAYPPEYWRDVDRGMGKMYYGNYNGGSSSGGSSGGNRGGSSGSSGSMSGGGSGNSSGGSRGYSEGFEDGNRAGYSEGYERGSREGESRGRNSGGNSRYERAKRGYEETKEAHKGNTPEDKQLTMREAEKVVNVILDEIDEMLEGTAPEVKNMVKTKTMSRMQKIQ